MLLDSFINNATPCQYSTRSPPHHFRNHNQHMLLDSDTFDTNPHYDEYIEQLQNQRRRRLKEDYNRFDLSEGFLLQGKVKEVTSKKDLALLINRKKMKQQMLKLVEVSNVELQSVPTFSYSSSRHTRTSGNSRLLSPETLDSEAELPFEDHENDENHCVDDGYYIEFEPLDTFDEDEGFNQRDELEILQCHAFDDDDLYYDDYQQ